MLKPKRLIARDVPGAGWEISAEIGEEVNCGEFTMRADRPQTVTQMVAYEPWIQFAPTDWRDMIAMLMPQMIEAWNEKHGH